MKLVQHVEGVERAAHALWSHEGPGRTAPPGEWARMPEEVRETWRERARVVIAAYQER